MGGDGFVLVAKVAVKGGDGEKVCLREHGVGPGVELLHSSVHVLHARLRREALVQIIDELRC